MSLDELTFWTPAVIAMILIIVACTKLTCQDNNIKHLCFKVVQTELKNDPEIQDICKDVKITFGEMKK